MPRGAAGRPARSRRAANQLVHGLRARGLRHGDAVAVLLPNGEPLVSTLLAVMQAGWHWVPINTHLTASEVAWIVADSGARAFVAHERYAAVARAAADEAGLAASARSAVGRIDGFASFESLLAGQPTARPGERLAGQFMQYTSGTTGRPKAVQRSTPAFDPDQMAAMLAPNLARYDITPGGDHVHLVTSPMYHLAPLSFGYFSLHFGHPVVLMDHFEPEEALRLIERHRVTTTHMVPTQFHRLMLLPEETRRRYDVSSLRHVMHAAAPCPVELKRKMLDWWGPVIYEYYGASEGGGTLVRAAEWLEKPGTVGRPWPGAGVRVLDDEGKDLPPGEVGTVFMKLTMDFAYKGDPEKTRASRRGEWFSVGDIGWLDADGYLFLDGPQDRHDHHGRRERVPGRDRGGAARAPRGRRRRGVRRSERGVGRGGEGGGRAGARCRRGRGARRAPARALPRAARRLQVPAHDRLHGRPCRATRTASSTSASCATRTGSGASGRSERRSARGSASSSAR